MPSERKIKIWILSVFVIFVSILLIAFFVKYFYQRSMGKGYMPGPSIVNFTKVTAQSWQQKIESVGTVYAHHGITVKASATGEITKMFVLSGRFVQQGEKLFQINPRVLRAQLKQDLSALKFSEQEYLRYKKIYQEGAVTSESLDAKKNQYQINLATYQKAKQQLALTVIKAPFSGYLGLTQVHLGSYVLEGAALATLQTKKNLYVQFSLPGQESRLVKLGDHVMISSEESPGKQVRGVVTAIDSSVNPDTRMLRLRATLDNAELMPGSYVPVNLFVGSKKQVKVLPQVAVVSSTNGDYVYKVVKGKAVEALVKSGERRGNFVEILSGVNVGDTVVNGGQIKVIPGFPVTEKGAITLTPKKGNAK